MYYGCVHTVASLRLVSPGSVTNGVTFFPQKVMTHNRHYFTFSAFPRWSIVQCSCKFSRKSTLSTVVAHRWCHPGRSPAPSDATVSNYATVLPRCMECRRGLANSFLSVCVCQMRALWQNGRKVCLYFYTIRKTIYPSFLRKRMVGGDDPFYLKFSTNRPPLERNRRFWTNNRS